MARIGKIARLPEAVRSQLNTRLQDGGEGKLIVRWLNSLPEVKQALAENFNRRPVSEQNLSDWRQGGYEEWLARQDILAHAADLAAHRQELETVAPGQSPADYLAAALSFRYGAILAAPGLELDEKALTQLKALGRTCQAVVKLRRSDHNAARLKIEMERWEVALRQMAEDRAEEVKRKQREALAAPIWEGLKKQARRQQFGGGEAGKVAAEYLYEVETCADPAHFQSKVMAAQPPGKWVRECQEMEADLAKNPPVKRSPMQAALDLLQEMDDGLEKLSKRKSRVASAPPRSSACRRARKPVEPQARRYKATKQVEPQARPCKETKPVEPQARNYNATESGVPRTESAQPEDKVSPDPAPAGPLDAAPLAPESSLPAIAPVGAAMVVESSLRLESGLPAVAPAGAAMVVGSSLRLESSLPSLASPGGAEEAIKAGKG